MPRSSDAAVQMPRSADAAVQMPQCRHRSADAAVQMPQRAIKWQITATA
jgi:hypothetical protein